MTAQTCTWPHCGCNSTRGNHCSAPSVLSPFAPAAALGVPEVAALVEAAKGLAQVLNEHEGKGPLPDVALMMCWLAAQNVRAAMRALEAEGQP